MNDIFFSSTSTIFIKKCTITGQYNSYYLLDGHYIQFAPFNGAAAHPETAGCLIAKGFPQMTKKEMS